jgi:hypothetical protein
MRRRAGLTGLVMAATLVGCGGSDQPTPEQRRAAAARWVERADAACEQAKEAIVGRGAAADLADVDRVATGAAEDVRAEAAEIRRLRPPPHLRAKARAFADALARVEDRMDRLTAATARGEPKAIRIEMLKLDPEWQEVDWQGHKAGLKACADHGLWAFSSTAWMPPVFVEEYASYLKRYTRQARAFRRYVPVETKPEAIAYFTKLRNLAERMESDLQSLDPPGEVLDQTFAYQDALYELQTAADGMVGVARRSPDVETSVVRRRYRRLVRAAAREARTRNALTRALGGGGRRHRAPAPAPSSGDES